MMSALLTVEAASPLLRGPALELLFQAYPPKERALRVATTNHLFETGQLKPDCLFILREEGHLVGVLLCLPIPGALALVWPPQVVPGPQQQQRERLLLEKTSIWLRSRGAKLAQVLLHPREFHQARPLLENGYRHVGSLCSLRHNLDLSTLPVPSPPRLQFQPYSKTDELQFIKTMEATYEQTLDIPEISGIRSSAEIMIGHQSQGRFDPDRWWLALYRNQPAGVLLLTEFPETADWDLAYLGLIARLRGQGLGTDLVRHALRQARKAGVAGMSVSVDARNLPAYHLYLSHGFQEIERREIVLGMWPHNP